MAKLAASMLLLALCACAPAPQHGTMSSLSQAKSADWQACEHHVPQEVCTRCNPELEASFKEVGDWCREHAVPESQCLKCSPNLDFSPPDAPPEGADVETIVHGGQDVPELEPHLVAGTMTVFDFYASWCPPCRDVDHHLYSRQRELGFAIRKLDVASWTSPLAKRWLDGVAELPFLVVYDRHGERVTELRGADLDAIDRALADGMR